MRTRSLDLRADLALAAFLVLGLCLAILTAATGLQWLSTHWTATCRHLLPAPSLPTPAAPWRVDALRVGGPRLDAPCLRP